MTFPELSLLLDIALAGLLAAVIGYAIVLNRNLKALRNSKEELERLLSGFSAATGQAEDAIERAKDAATHNASSLNGIVRKAESLREDLTFLIERGEKIADAMESGIARNRARAAEPDGLAEAPAPVSRDSGAGDGGDLDRLMRQARQLADKPPARPLAPRAEDRPAVTGTPSAGGKTKTALLKALQGMR